MLPRSIFPPPQPTLSDLVLVLFGLMGGCAGDDGSPRAARDAGMDVHGDSGASQQEHDQASDAASQQDDDAGEKTGDDGGKPTSTPKLPPSNAGLDYQLGEAYTPAASVKIVSRDRNAKPAPGLYNICYVNGFQAQPDEETFWLDEHPDLILRDGAGKPIIDQDWHEMLLDVSSMEKRTKLAAIVGGWIVGCAEAGFSAVEIDNLDSYSRSSGRIVEGDAVAFIRLLADRAHAEGLAIAQKNSAELVDRRAEMKTDFVVAEECNRYSECDVYTDAYGEHVLLIEYRRQDFDKGCAEYPNLSIVLRDLNLVAPSGGSYVYDGC